MTIYAALLREIHVGGKNKMKMADLRDLCNEIGFTHVQTYMQSGNLIFLSDLDKDNVRQLLENAIQQKFQLKLVVILRTYEELEQIIEQCPFSSEEIEASMWDSTPESLYIALLLQSPLPERVNQLSISYEDRTDRYVVLQDTVYLLFKDSELANRLAKLAALSTMRNWKTMTKLVEMARETKESFK